MKRILMASALPLLLLTACKKENNQCSKTMAAIAGTYKVTKVEQGFSGSYTDMTNDVLDACEKDDLTVLEASGTATYTDAGTKCSPDGSSTGSWSIASNGTMNLNAGDIDLLAISINSFNCSALVLEKNFADMGSPELSVRYTLTKQ